MPFAKGHTDGKIIIKKVSRAVLQKRLSNNQNFHPRYDINYLLKASEWIEIYRICDHDLTIDEFLSEIQDNYEIYDLIASNLVLNLLYYYLTDTFSQ